MKSKFSLLVALALILALSPMALAQDANAPLTQKDIDYYTEFIEFSLSSDAPLTNPAEVLAAQEKFAKDHNLTPERHQVIITRIPALMTGSATDTLSEPLKPAQGDAELVSKNSTAVNEAIQKAAQKAADKAMKSAQTPK
jgi:hypothetical protein